jgi:YD repeat-containing protein
MIAYKATYNYKCRNQTYQVGKTYTSDKLKICFYGMHYCDNMEDTLIYYKPTKDFILLEVEILGDVETEEEKSVTNKLKVLRVVPPNEYSDIFKSRFPTFEYDDCGNMISKTFPDGYKITYEYDNSGNKISMTYPNGGKYTYVYDSSGNMISMTYPDGNKYTYEYDSSGNKISQTYPDGDKDTYKYDNLNNMISRTHSNGRKYTLRYDDRGNIISETYPDGSEYAFDVAIITEED